MKLLLFSASALLVIPAFAADDVRGDHPDSKPSTPEEELAKFHVPPGFEVQLVAAEPDIQKPINLNFDAAGQLWVSGSELYPWPAATDPNGEPIPGFDKGWQSIIDGFRVGDKAPQPAPEGRDSVRVLGDFDATGRARKITVFADKLSIPGGVQPLPHGSPAIAAAYGMGPNYDPNPAMAKLLPLTNRHIGQAPKGDSAIVYSIPNIWLMTDWDGDGFAESRIPLYTGFGYTDTHGGSSSYIYWIDGWIYGTHGFRNHSEVTDRNGKVTVLDSGNTYRFRPDGTAFEIFTHGQTNPFGLAFDPLGNLYSADSHSKPVYMLVRGGFYEGIGKQHDGLGFAPRITDDDHGSSAIGGIIYYADDKWPEEYRGNLFNGNPVTQKINRDKLEWHGSTPKAIRQPDFLSNDDPWFRPVSLKLGPDGALYIADFYNPIIGHYEVPLTHPARDHTHGRIWRVVYRGESAGSAASDSVPSDLTGLNALATMEKLRGASLETRRLVINELADRLNRRSGGPLEFAADKGSSEMAAAAIWGLERLDALGFRVKTGERSAHIQALKVLADRATLTSDDHALIKQALADTDGAICRAAVEAMATHPSPDQLAPILARAVSVEAEDSELRYAIRIALRENLAEPGGCDEAVALAQTDAPAAEMLADASLAVKTSDSADFLLAHLERTALQSPRAGEYLKHTALNISEERFDEVVKLIAKANDAPLPQRLALGDALTGAARQRGIKLPEDAIAWSQRAMLEALDSQDAALVKSAIDAARDVPFDAKLEPLSRIVRDPSRDGAVRIAAMGAVANLPASHDLLLKTFNDDSRMTIRERAAELLVQNGAFAPVLSALPQMPWEIALAIAGGLAKSDAGTTALLDTIDAGKASPRLLVNKAVSGPLTSRAKPLRDRAATLTQDLPPEDARLDKVINARAQDFRNAKPEAVSAERGAQVFQQNCVNCHRFRNAGGNVGPNLDGVVARGVNRLVEDILDPNRNVDPGFRQTVVETTDGQTLVGTNLREQSDAIALIDATGKELNIPKNTIKTRNTLALSMMPPIFETQITPADFNDLLAFLLGGKQ